MAHDFEIRVKDAPWIKKVSKFKELREDSWHDCEEEYLDIPDEYRAYFFGYAEGIMYLAFNMESHCMGFSGDNIDIEIDRETALKGISKAIEYYDKSNYPDPTKMDDIKAFCQRMQNEFKDYPKYIICYS